MTTKPQHRSGTRKEESRLAFADWLVTPQSKREPKTQNELAAKLGVARSTLSEWHRLPLIQALVADYRAAYKGQWVQVVDSMMRRARNGNVPAARLLAEVLGELSPTKSEVSVEETSVTFTRPEDLRDYAKGVLQDKAKVEQQERAN